MSCCQLSQEHIAAIAGSAIHYQSKTKSQHDGRGIYYNGTYYDGPGIAKALAKANADSMNARYPSDLHPTIPCPVTLERIARYERNPLSLRELGDALCGYDYQTSECPDYPESLAFWLVYGIRKVALKACPETKRNCWTIPDGGPQPHYSEVTS